MREANTITFDYVIFFFPDRLFYSVKNFFFRFWKSIRESVRLIILIGRQKFTRKPPFHVK